MNTQITSKLAVVVVALMMNVLILGGVAFLFEGTRAHETSDSSLAAKQTTQAAAHDVV